MITTSLSAICAASPCRSGIRKLLAHLGTTMDVARIDEAPLPVLVVLESNGLDDALWVLDRATVGTEFLRRLLAADYAERVHHLFAAERPGDDRPMNAIRTARDPNATAEQLAAARDAAGDAAGDAAWAAARDAAWAAAGAAARDAARDNFDALIYEQFDVPATVPQEK